MAGLFMPLILVILEAEAEGFKFKATLDNSVKTLSQNKT